MLLRLGISNVDSHLWPVKLFSTKKPPFLSTHTMAETKNQSSCLQKCLSCSCREPKVLLSAWPQKFSRTISTSCSEPRSISCAANEYDSYPTSTRVVSWMSASITTVPVKSKSGHKSKSSTKTPLLSDKLLPEQPQSP